MQCPGADNRRAKTTLLLIAEDADAERIYRQWDWICRQVFPQVVELWGHVSSSLYFFHEGTCANTCNMENV